MAHVEQSVLVFTQTPNGHIDAAQLVSNARKFFSVEMEVLLAEPAPDRCQLIELTLDGARFQVQAREVQDSDLARARTAERSGRAAGMSDLAARCGHVWCINDSAASERSALLLQALLASVALGPVLPVDDSTLYGVRGARERADRISASS